MKRYFLLTFAVLLLAGSGYAQRRTILGLVRDAETGDSLKHASIILKGAKTGRMTDTCGFYRFDIPNDSTATLIFSYIGYEPQEVIVGNRKLVDVALKRKIEAPLEVNVVGYYTVRKKELTSASVAVMSSLQGKVSGVSIRGSRSVSRRSSEPMNTEDYSPIEDNGFVAVKNKPLSTFSSDVDKASYSVVRRFITDGTLPPKDAVRVEELINYFDYSYDSPTGNDPVLIDTEVATCPWNENHRLLKIGLQARKIEKDKLPPSNLVFLIDVSGSMSGADRLGLVKSSFKMLVKELRPQDRVAIVVYAGSAGMVLPSTSGAEKETILNVLDRLEAGGSTAGGAGIQLAYQTAVENFIKGGNNRVIIATDGDFNVGVSSDGELQRLIEEKRKTGVYLSVLGYGMGNYKDNKLETLADKGNGNYAYINDIGEANRTLVKEFGGTLFTIAKDVKLQVEFNPAYVQGYRLVGYENRLLNDEDFKDDKKDAGDMGAGHTVTALYELIPAGQKTTWLKSVDKLKYQAGDKGKGIDDGELLTVKVRYKQPNGSKSNVLEKAVANSTQAFDAASENFRFAATVASFGMLLRDSEFKQNATYDSTISMAKAAKGTDDEGDRAELISLMNKARLIKDDRKDSKGEGKD